MSLSRNPSAVPSGDSLSVRPRFWAGRWIYVGAILALMAGMLGYRLLVAHNLEQTAALFIGLPALMGILLVLCPQPKSLTGMILKVMCLGLLLSGPVLQEGFICILMASPLFLGIGAIIGLTIEYRRRRRAAKAVRGVDAPSLLLTLPLLVMSLEGTLPELSFPRTEIVSVSQIVAASPEEVENKLGQTAHFRAIPSAVKWLGFPLPVDSQGSGLAVGDERLVKFAGGEGKPGDLRLRVTESRPGFVRFTAMSDTSHYAHWMDWEHSEVQWKANPDGTTTVRWTVQFDRRLDPAWYFRPSERAMVKWAANHLIETCATPQG